MAVILPARAQRVTVLGLHAEEGGYLGRGEECVVSGLVGHGVPFDVSDCSQTYGRKPLRSIAHWDHFDWCFWH